jgi:hypothetical protein
MSEDPQLSGGIALWYGLRQLQAIREALGWTLDRELHFHDGNKQIRLNDETRASWLAGQDCASNAPSIYSAIDEHRNQLLGAEAYEAIQLGRRSRALDLDDHGHERSGAGWEKAIEFCITSAFVRLLGAWEQYELDVLKALFYYRPGGELLGPPEEQVVREAEVDVVREEPSSDGYVKPPIWTWVRKHAENNIERRKILARVFAIEVTPGTTNKERNENNCKRDDWYDKRNAIVHGRKQVIMSLHEFLEVEVFIFRSMRHLSRAVLARHQLVA